MPVNVVNCAAHCHRILSVFGNSSRRRDRSVCMATGYFWKARVWFPAAQDFSLFHNFSTGSGAHPVSYLLDVGGVSFPGDKAAGG
jgi:hypothetical protein